VEAVRPWVAPYSPAAHWVQNPAPAREYCPVMHWAAVGEVDPAPQAYPAVQFPEQAAVARPLELPNFPAGHAVQDDAPARE
jgi:hypothetical protein